MDRNICAVVNRDMYKVALRKESVDRNIILLVRLYLLMRRSPQGERG